MKKITLKFFLLTMGLILSVGASAQEIQHRYPEVTYKIGANTYKLPAWDVQMGSTYQFRIQALEPKPESTATHVRGKIVGRRAFSTEKVNYGDYLFSANPSKVSCIPFGETEFVEKSIGDWTYGMVFGVKGVNEGGLMEPGANDADKSIFGGSYTATDLEIPSTHLTASNSNSVYAGYTFDIVEIGVGAFRNLNLDNQNILKVTGTLTIPSSIEVIESNAFRHNVFTKVILAKDEKGVSHLTTIGQAAFAGCTKLKEINIPASVTTIEGMALGGCNVLEKVIFEGTTVPTFTKVVEEPDYNDNGSTYTGPYDIFHNSQRFITNGLSKNVTPSKCIIEVPYGTAKAYVEANDGLLKQFPLKSEFSMGKKMISYCSDLDFTLKQYDTSSKTWSNGDVKAYYVVPSDVKVEEGRVLLTEIREAEKIPSTNFGVVLIGEEGGGTYDIFYPNDIMSSKVQGVNNCLKGVLTSTYITIDDDYLYYVLSSGQFLPVKQNGTLGANKAYIEIENDGDIQVPIKDAPSLSVTLPEETGIVNHELNAAHNDTFYTLQGIQVKQPTKGIFIKNGKKYIIK